MILSDREIKDRSILSPFIQKKTESIEGVKAISFGVSSYGYDLRLSPEDFRIAFPVDTIINPKIDNRIYKEIQLIMDNFGDYFVIPGRAFALGVSVERFNMPKNLTGICIGKSTYARHGLMVNLTPVEAGWQGHLTIELYNPNLDSIMVFANEGICQVLFFQGEPCDRPYGDGKYQNQQHEVTLAR